MQSRPYVVAFRLADDPDWKLTPSKRLHDDPASAANHASDFIREWLMQLGVDRNTARAHVTGPRTAVREHPETPVPVALPGHNTPLLHVMAARVAVPAIDAPAATAA